MATLDDEGRETIPQDHQKRRLTAEEIIAFNDTKTDEVWIEEWGTDVKVVGLTKRQQLDIRTKATVDGDTDEEKVQQGMFLEGVIEPRFTEDQLAAVFEKNAGAVDKVLKRVLELSGMKPEDAKAKEAAFPKIG